MNKISVFLIISFIFLIQGISVASVRDLSAECQESRDCETIIPQKVGLYLTESNKSNPLPALVFTVYAGGGCDQVSGLKITRELKSSQPNIFTKGGRIDILEIEIHGYQIKRAVVSSDLACPAVIAEARETIEISDYMSKSQLQLKVRLNKNENHFDLNLYGGVLYLNPLDSDDIISFSPGENMPDKPRYLGAMTTDFSDRLAKVRVQGAYAHDSDLGTCLRDYIRDSGYEPLDEKLQGYLKMNPLEDFIVFVPKEKENPKDFKIIGQVKYQEKIAGEKAIDVGIEKTVISPFFFRNSQ